jgi:hypothetical protein
VVYSNSNCRHFVDKYHLLNFDCHLLLNLSLHYR